MTDAAPILLIPALYCSARLYAEQIPALWSVAPVMVANHTRGDSIAEIAAQILAEAPPRFALGGLSMGGYTALEIMRQAPERVTRLALMDTSARADTPEQTAGRAASIATVQRDGFDAFLDQAWQIAVDPARTHDADLRQLYRTIAWDVGPERFMRQQAAIGKRPDSRPHLGRIACPTLVMVGAQDVATPPHLAEEMAAAIPGARLVRVPDCGHLATIERPQDVTRILVEWAAGG
ncbi:alpha/beta fold hydrolase [Zavarzinia sp. CC-PAN008]|uniref:alpha/beta fold hydrolase n=1 Tax=Zavarzinia sp. CC-PAN008 TaxID=3243332 RepID=UPI003F743001